MDALFFGVIMKPYPAQDDSRLDRIVNDVCVMLHNDEDKTKEIVKRWVFHVLNKARQVKRFWFLENSVGFVLHQGQDVVDLVGQIDMVISLIGVNGRLNNIPISKLSEFRCRAHSNKSNNSGIPSHYAIESGKRLHLWPCPPDDCYQVILYSRPIAFEIVPSHWETILLDGILGFYGRHFDKDELTQDPQEFERRFYEAVRAEKDGSFDVIQHYQLRGNPSASSRFDSSLSNQDQSLKLTAPASLTGIGHASVQLGDYPLEVSE